MTENAQSRESEPDDQNDPGTPVPNRRERRGGKPTTSEHHGTGPVRGDQSRGANRRQYTTRRRGGR